MKLKNELLIPAPVLQLLEEYVKSKPSNYRTNVEQRLLAVRDAIDQVVKAK